MIPQGNLVCRAAIPIVRNHPAAAKVYRIPAGRLRAVGIANHNGGTNSRRVFFRIPEDDEPQSARYWQAFGGFADWYPVYSNGNINHRTVCRLTVNSDTPIEVQTFGTADEDCHPVQLTFWYEPDCIGPFRTNPETPQAENRG